MSMKHGKKEVQLYGVCELTYTHRDLYFDLKELGFVENVDFFIVVQKPGELIILNEFVSHSVRNTGRNCAESQNYILPGNWKTVAAYKFCKHSVICGAQPEWNSLHGGLEHQIKIDKILLNDCMHWTDPERKEKLLWTSYFKEIGDVETAKAMIDDIKLRVEKPAYLKHIIKKEEVPADPKEYQLYQNFECHICGWISHHSHNYQDHMVKKHNQPRPDPPKAQCPLCPAEHSQLQHHMRTRECKLGKAEQLSADPSKL